MALLMGLGGGMTRDVFANEVPAALTNPAYIVLALAVIGPTAGRWYIDLTCEVHPSSSSVANGSWRPRS